MNHSEFSIADVDDPVLGQFLGFLAPSSQIT